MKKLVLKIDIVARINNNDMNHLRGGIGSEYICGPSEGHTCDGAFTCQGNTCGNTCDSALTCPGHNTCPATCVTTCANTCASCKNCVTTASIGCY